MTVQGHTSGLPLIFMRTVFNWLKKWMIWRKRPPSARQRALNLIAAVDAGGVPLNPARVNDIARQLGLEVSRKAPLEDTLARIRKALTYQDH